MRKVIYTILIAFIFGLGSPVASELINAKSDITAQSRTRKKKSKGKKTVKVKSYRKKNGKRVKSYKRKPPKKKRR